MPKFIIVSDLHITNDNQKTPSLRSLYILKNFVNIVKKHKDNEEIMLVVVGDWFDNIHKVSSIDIKITNMIFDLFDYVFFLDGNHDVYTSVESNLHISSSAILRNYKKCKVFEKQSVMKINNLLYFWFLPFSNNSNEISEFISNTLSNLFNNASYNNNQLHIFFSHMSIKEIEEKYQNDNETLFSYFKFQDILNRYQINYQFFQAHYHLKYETEKIINDKHFHIISTYPKSFSEKITKLNDYLQFGYYILNENEIQFETYENLFLFYELQSQSKINFDEFLSFVKNNSNNQYFVKFVLNDKNNYNEVISFIEILKNYVNKISLVINYKIDQDETTKETHSGEEQIETNKNVLEYLKHSIRSSNNFNDELKELIICKLVELYNAIDEQKGDV